MLDNLFTNLLGELWFRRLLAIAVLLGSYRLTEWAMIFANSALQAKADLIGTAGILAAVTAAPVGLLTVMFSNYNEKRAIDVA